jgi:hypothetical protein
VGPGPRVRDWAVISGGGDEEARYRGRRFTFRARATVRFSAPGVQRSIRMTCGPGPPCHRLGRLGFRCAPAGISRSVSGRKRESLS